MTPYELYEKYKGRRGKFTYELDPDEEPSLGIIVGYCTDETSRGDMPLIMSVTSGYGWGIVDLDDHIMDVSYPSTYQYCTLKGVQLKFGR